MRIGMMIQHGRQPQKTADVETTRHESVAALGELEAERRRDRPVKAQAETIVVLQPVEVEIGAARGDLPCIVEHR